MRGVFGRWSGSLAEAVQVADGLEIGTVPVPAVDRPVAVARAAAKRRGGPLAGRVERLTVRGGGAEFPGVLIAGLAGPKWVGKGGNTHFDLHVNQS